MSDAAAPVVSVVLPTWNRLAYLERTVASVRAQTHRAWELIVVDDGSTDGSAAWLRGLADPRVTVLERSHTGSLPHLRNVGNAAARAPLIALLDSDDLWEPDKLARQVAAMDANPECGWSYTDAWLIDDAGRRLGERRTPFLALSGRILPQLLRFEAPVASPTVMFRRELLAQIGGWDESLPRSADYELFFRMAERSPCVALPERLASIRVHAGALTQDRAPVNEAWVVIYERFGARSADPEVRRICEELAHDYRLGSASWRARGGERGRALAHVAAALRRRPASLRAWKALVGDVLLRGSLRARRADGGTSGSRPMGDHRS